MVGVEPNATDFFTPLDLARALSPAESVGAGVLRDKTVWDIMRRRLRRAIDDREFMGGLCGRKRRSREDV